MSVQTPLATGPARSSSRPSPSTALPLLLALLAIGAMTAALLRGAQP